MNTVKFKKDISLTIEFFVKIYGLIHDFFNMFILILLKSAQKTIILITTHTKIRTKNTILIKMYAIY